MVARSVIFASQDWLWALPAVLLAGILLWPISRRLIKQRLGRFISSRLVDEALPTVSWAGKFFRFALMGLILMLLAVALARPLTGPRPDSAERKGVDFVVALDVSKSMWVEDVKPNRLAAVKQALGDWLKKQNGDRVGLVLFAGDAYVQAPMTFDYNALNLVLQDAGPASISKGGSNLAEALEVGGRMLKRNEAKALIVVSDGENLEGDTIAAASQARQEYGISIFTIGVGTPQGGKVPAQDGSKPAAPGQTGRPYVRNEYGVDASSRLDRQALRSLAAVGGGKYYDFQPGVFQAVRDTGLLPLVQKSQSFNVRDYFEWYQIPLAAAILLMILEPMIPTARRRREPQQIGVAVVKPANFSAPARASRKKRPVAVSLVAAFAALSLPAQASPTSQAEKLLAEGKPAEAVEYMRQQSEKNEGDLYLLYNYGLTLYRAGQYEDAADVFQVVAYSAEDANLKIQAMLQLGNGQYRLSEQLKTGGQGGGAVLALEQALGSYDALLEERSDKMAKHNRQLTLEHLEALLLEVAESRTKIGGENALREALQAYERATEIDKSHQPLVDEAKKRLEEELTRLGQKFAKQGDDLEAAQKPAKQIVAVRSGAIAKYEEALQLDPENKDLQAAIKEQQDKMSNALTREAQQQSAPLLAKPTLTRQEQALLENILGNVAQALAMNEKNAAAQTLDQQIQQKLIDSYNAAGQAMLEDFQVPHRKAGGRLFAANKAAEAFTRALTHDPENAEATKGLEKAKELLPEANAAVAQEQLSKAEGMVQGDPAAQATEALQGAAGLLETSMQHFGNAAGMRPDNPGFQKGLANAENLLAKVRDQLEQRMPAGDPNAEGPTADAGALQSMNALRGKGGDGEEVPSQRFWDSKLRDW